MDVLLNHVRGVEIAFDDILPSQQSAALSIIRDMSMRLHDRVRVNLEGDALKTVQAVAENIIHETYGFDLGFEPIHTVDHVSIQPTLSHAIYQSLDPNPMPQLLIENNDFETSYAVHNIHNVTTDGLTHKTTDSASICKDISETLQILQQANGLFDNNSPEYVNEIPPEKVHSLVVRVEDRKSRRVEKKVVKDQILQCPQCKFTTNFRQSLHRHKKKMHSKSKIDRNFICDVCSKGFFTKSALREHELYKHSDKSLSKFVCELCPNICFSLRKDLNRHNRFCHL